MSYLRRFPPQGGRSGEMLRADATEVPTTWAELAALLWKNGITAIADLRETADPNLKEHTEDAGVAYGHIGSEERRQRLRNAEARYRTLLIVEQGQQIDTEITIRPLPTEEAAQ